MFTKFSMTIRSRVPEVRHTKLRSSLRTSALSLWSCPSEEYPEPKSSMAPEIHASSVPSGRGHTLRCVGNGTSVISTQQMMGIRNRSAISETCLTNPACPKCIWEKLHETVTTESPSSSHLRTAAYQLKHMKVHADNKPFFSKNG